MTQSSNISVFEFEEVSSTNSLALEKVKQGTPCPAWFTAKTQTEGRGRGSKEWVSLDGNLFASFICEQTGRLSSVTEIGFVCALACFDTICEVAPRCSEWLQLKWPNDVLLSQKKVAGILLETEQKQDGEGWYLVAGFGINLVAHPNQTDWPATHLATENFGLNRDECLKALMSNLSNWLAIWEDKGFGPIRETWVARGPELGVSMTVKHHGTKISGSYGGLDHDGGLLMIRDSGEMTKIIVGYVSDQGQD